MAINKFPTVRSAYASMTVAELYAGVILVPAAADRRYTVLDCWVRSTGSFATAHVAIGDGTTTVATFLNEGTTNGALLRGGTATTGVATELLTSLAVNAPIKVSSDSLEGTATVLEVYVEYAVSTVMETL